MHLIGVFNFLKIASEICPVDVANRTLAALTQTTPTTQVVIIGQYYQIAQPNNHYTHRMTLWSNFIGNSAIVAS